MWNHVYRFIEQFRNYVLNLNILSYLGFFGINTAILEKKCETEQASNTILQTLGEN